ncbi:hypothetical protein Syun_029745 [Stephania yunnanensis]|uniref:Secreted protein n=1 Tax=Stephania yunnanensis TaxID=152371 RepID=A0AAP0E668_9MAGN
MVSSRAYLLLLHWTSSFSSDGTTGAPPPPLRGLAARLARNSDRSAACSSRLTSAADLPAPLTLASALRPAQLASTFLRRCYFLCSVPPSSFTLLRGFSPPSSQSLLM